ncbi:tyrosine-type recombinase/integrase [Paenibacillus qinlingensis]|uniref:tyrosine-type recombinase/integrase n=1 Tax=Paenibacillus qinlingensis TaxID=1837343 RepID=UPI001562F639|nr:tyrosine-type recombinase/integrase [Paenibacillus qinlingensis]
MNLDIKQLQPNDPESLRFAKKPALRNVNGKGGTQRNVFLSEDAKHALADYIEKERPNEIPDSVKALFVNAVGASARLPDGRLDPRTINRVLEQIGKWHDKEQNDLDRHISPLSSHDLRHTFAFRLSRETNGDKFELQRRLGHRSDKYIEIYTNPPEELRLGMYRRM